MLACVCGQNDFRYLYPTLYDLFSREGPKSLPYPLARADPINLSGTVGSYSLVGCLMAQLWPTVMVVLVALLVVPSPVCGWMRMLVEVTISLIAVNKLLVQRIIIPFAQRFELGIVLYVVQLYLYLGHLVSGARRIGLLVIISSLSFFWPHRCILPAGVELQDSCHVFFMAVVMDEVDADARKAKEQAAIPTGRRQ
jgi:hypothetical protein